MSTKKAPKKKVAKRKTKTSSEEIRLRIAGSNTIPSVNLEFRNLAEASKDILQKAKEIIYGDREKTYGNPGFNLQSIADFWTVYLRRKNPDVHIDAVTMTDVAQLMILLKTARLINSPSHIDSLVDQCGYAALHERVL